MFDRFKKLLRGKAEKPEQSKLTPEQDIAVAREALGRGEFQHAAFHVGCALMSNPNRPDWIAVLLSEKAGAMNWLSDLQSFLGNHPRLYIV